MWVISFLQYEHPSDIRQPVLLRPKPVPIIEGGEYIFDKELNDTRRSRGYQCLTLMEGNPEYEADRKIYLRIYGKLIKVFLRTTTGGRQMCNSVLHIDVENEEHRILLLYGRCILVTHTKHVCLHSESSIKGWFH